MRDGLREGGGGKVQERGKTTYMYNENHGVRT